MEEMGAPPTGTCERGSDTSPVVCAVMPTRFERAPPKPTHTAIQQSTRRTPPITPFTMPIPGLAPPDTAFSPSPFTADHQVSDVTGLPEPFVDTARTASRRGQTISSRSRTVPSRSRGRRSLVRRIHRFRRSRRSNDGHPESTRGTLRSTPSVGVRRRRFHREGSAIEDAAEAIGVETVAGAPRRGGCPAARGRT